MSNNYDIVKEFIIDAMKYPDLAPRCLEALTALNIITGKIITPDQLTCVNVTTDKIMAGCVDEPHYKS